MTDPGDARWRAAVEVLDQWRGDGYGYGAGGGGDEPEVIRDGLALLVRQGDVLVRARPRSLEPVAYREVEVAQALAEAGVRVTRLIAGSGVAVAHGCAVTAWEWLATTADSTPAECGQLARDLRERTAGSWAHQVPRFDPISAIRNTVADLPVGDEQGDFIRHRAHALSGGWASIADTDPAGTAIVHGDLHGDNVLSTTQGPVLTDLELAGGGPCSYDTAPAVVSVARYGADPATLERFVAAQGLDPREWSGFDTCVSIYELWVAAWAVGVRDRSTRLAAEATRRVGSLRDRTNDRWTLL